MTGRHVFYEVIAGVLTGVTVDFDADTETYLNPLTGRTTTRKLEGFRAHYEERLAAGEGSVAS